MKIDYQNRQLMNVVAILFFVASLLGIWAHYPTWVIVIFDVVGFIFLSISLWAMVARNK